MFYFCIHFFSYTYNNKPCFLSKTTILLLVNYIYILFLFQEYFKSYVKNILKYTLIFCKKINNIVI